MTVTGTTRTLWRTARAVSAATATTSDTLSSDCCDCAAERRRAAAAEACVGLALLEYEGTAAVSSAAL